MAAAEHDGSDHLIPQEFICPITGEIMEDPVSTIDGNSYERTAIERWFATRRITSPLTGARLGPGTWDNSADPQPHIEKGNRRIY